MSESEFPLLNETNYATWVIRMEARLVQADLWDQVVYEKDPTATDEDDKKAFETWSQNRSAKKMAEARSEILLSVENSQLAHMRSRDPRIIWEELRQVHVARNLSMRLALRRRFIRLVKDKDETMATWVGRVKALAYRLQDIGVEVTDEDMVVVLTNGLGESYAAFVIMLDGLPTESLTLRMVVDLMLDEETRREIPNKPEFKSEAFTRRSNAGPGGSLGGDVNFIRCWRCGRVGHMMAFCKEGFQSKKQ